MGLPPLLVGAFRFGKTFQGRHPEEQDAGLFHVSIINRKIVVEWCRFGFRRFVKLVARPAGYVVALRRGSAQVRSPPPPSSSGAFTRKPRVVLPLKSTSRTNSVILRPRQSGKFGP